MDGFLDNYDRETIWKFMGDDKFNLKMVDQDVLSGNMNISVKVILAVELISDKFYSISNLGIQTVQPIKEENYQKLG